MSVDKDGRSGNVWQWAVGTGKHAIDTTSRILKRLEVPGLKLEDDDAASAPKTPGAVGGGNSAARTKASEGYDPYGGNRGAARPSTAGKISKPPAAAKPRRSLWQRLFRRD